MDADGYVYMDPPKRHLQASKQSKGCSFNLCCKIVLGISVVGNVALAVLLILLIHDFQVYSVSKSAPYQIQSCLLNCIPCRSATNSVKANLTLDPSTAHPQLHVSSDLKNVRWKGMKQQVKGSLLRYELWPSVLSHESFNSGKLCWEVEVVAEGNWGVGIVRESAN
ncbi:butyrophilin subfamily 1 member A1-like isoform X1 [Crotalus tigris]|uniref:butyrophilin subfamily 1 member A1-like isoform X1 n=1 Tax=Crotalus tigris TaxID=88082 RepID=UPI00192F8D90|nr:butyrophilin subfamily 1 member A1-like isoform X1 [Crotalus tigris]